MIIEKLNKLSSKIIMQHLSAKHSNVKDEMKYINHFEEPIDDIERSYFQYKCECFRCETMVTLFLKNFLAIFLIIFYIFAKCKKNIKKVSGYSYVFVFDGKNIDVLPDEYSESFKQIKIAEYMYLNGNDIRILKSIWKRYPFSFYFLLKCLIKIATYSAAIEMYNPIDVLCSCEYSFTSSILTYYCESKEKKHINIMHGLIAINSRLAFARFSCSCVWDKGFIETYNLLRAGTKKYLISIPKALRYETQKEKEIENVCKYYLQDTNENNIKKLAEIYKEISKKGLTMILRPHPVYTNINMIRDAIPDALIEDTRVVGIEKSLCEAEFIIARTSTVLYQASLMDKKIIIDDVSDPLEYEEWKERRLFFWTKNTDRLSQWEGKLR